jgi:hypothetical protein
VPATTGPKSHDTGPEVLLMELLEVCANRAGASLNNAIPVTQSREAMVIPRKRGIRNGSRERVIVIISPNRKLVRSATFRNTPWGFTKKDKWGSENSSVTTERFEAAFTMRVAKLNAFVIQ